MADNMIVYEAVKEVTTAVNSLVVTYRDYRKIDKVQKDILINNLRTYQHIQRSNSLGAIIRNNMQEVSKTMNLIDSLNMNGVSLDIAMRQLEIMANELDRIVQDYANGY